MTATDYLFVRPSFFRGVARLLDLGATLESDAYNRSSTPALADAKALASDWMMVGADLEHAICEYPRSAQYGDGASESK